MRNWKAQEQKRYNAIYEGKLHYGASDFKFYAKLFPELINPRLRTLDLGCGAAHLSNKYMDYTGIDISTEIIKRNRKLLRGSFHLGTLDDLERWRGWKYDQIHCNDVLEHVPEAMVGLVLKEISLLDAKVFYFKIHKGESNYKDEQGNLHRTIKENQWWLDMLSNWYTIEKNYFKGQGLERGWLSYFKCTKK